MEGPLRTVYFGGGTPSLLPPGSLQNILQTLRQKAGFDSSAEISMEANPETVDLEKLRAYRGLGVNRISFGAQSSQTEILKKLGRGHDWEQVRKSYFAAREAGFDNLNLDLMLGLPGQTLELFQQSLEMAADIHPDHLSLYALQVEEGTPLSRQVGAGLQIPTGDEMADQYSWAQDFLTGEGFEQYEVSNFARPGKSCRHNWNIWRGEDYWGFGVGAVGTVKGIRRTHGEDLMKYIQSLSDGKIPELTEEELGDSIREFERLMLGFRTREGVLKEAVDHYAARTGVSYTETFNRFQGEGLLSLEEGRYRVTSKGFFLLNGILEALVA